MLVSQLESHLNSGETQLRHQLRVHREASDTELDDLFLAEGYSKGALVATMPVLRGGGA